MTPNRASSAPSTETAPAAPTGTASFAEAPSPAAGSDTLEAETRGLRASYAAMEHGDPARALALLDQQSARFPHGQLGQERAAARVLALCRLGRTSEGRAAAASFLAAHPGSALDERVRKACSPR